MAAIGSAGQCRPPSGGWQPSLGREAAVGAALHRHDLAAAGKDLAESRHHDLMRDEHRRPGEVDLSDPLPQRLDLSGFARPVLKE